MLEQNCKKDYWLYILSMVLCISSVIPNQNLKIAIVASVFYISSIYKLCNPTLLLLVSRVIFNYEGNSLVSLVALLPAYINRKMLTRHVSAGKCLFAVLFLGTVVLAYGFGTDAKINTLIMFLMSWLVFLNISNQTIRTSELGKYGLISVVFICFALLTEMRNGGIQIIYGRLAVNDSIRELANAAAIAIILLTVSLLNNERSTTGYRIIRILSLVVATILLFLTLSKGAFIAVGGAFLILMLRSEISIPRKIACAFLIILVFVASFLKTSSIFRIARLFQKSDGFSGRTEIWSDYWKAMSSQITTLLLGFGSGDVRRLGINSSYSHSLILDVLFSYGICGFVLFVIAVVNVLIKSIRTSNKLALPVTVFGLLLYATHSVSTSVSFYILLGLTVSLSKQEIV